MGYEPTLIIRKSDLDKRLNSIELAYYSGDDEESKVAKFLLEVCKYDTFNFDGLELVLCRPEFTSFSKNVRDFLHDLGIDFREDN